MTKPSLSARFTLILGSVFLVGIVIGGFAHWRMLQQRAQEEIATQGVLLIEAMNAVRGYTTVHIRPLLADEIAHNPEFISETVPAYSARTVFENFRNQIDDHTYYYKEAALNPTNPLDLADEFEAELLIQMRNSGNTGEVSGYRSINNERLFYIARPLAIGAESCLECHSTPENAPASLIATYGDQGGFGWKLGEVIAVQIIYVPAGEVFDAALRTFMLVMSVFIITFALVIMLINTLLKRYVIQPVNLLGGIANKISADENFSGELESPELHSITRRPDELGSLAQVFRKMASDVSARTGMLKQQVNQLIIKIDEMRRKQQVADVVETDFFSDLQKRANELRNRAQDEGGESKAARD